MITKISQQYDNKQIYNIVVGNENVFWKDIVELNNSKNKEIQEAFGINNLCEYALKAYYIYSNTIEEGKFCLSYNPKTSIEDLSRKRQYMNLVETKDPFRGEKNDTLQTCGTVFGINEGTLFLKDKKDLVSIFFCNNCKRTYWGKYKKQRGPNKEYLLLQEGDACDRTDGCNGKLVKNQSYAIKRFLIGNIVDIVENVSLKSIESDEQSSAQPINFQKFLKKAYDNIAEIDKKVYDKYMKQNENISKQRSELSEPDPEPEENNSGALADNDQQMVSLARVKKKKPVKYKKIKRYWKSETHEAVKDYWRDLYGGGTSPSDNNSRGDYCDALVKNY